VPNLTVPLGTEVELVAEDAGGWIAYREDALEEAPREAPAARDAAAPPSAPPPNTTSPNASLTNAASPNASSPNGESAEPAREPAATAR